MTKNLRYLLLLTLLGSSSMADSEPNAGDEVAKEMISKDEGLSNEKKAQSEDKIDVSYPSLRQDQENTLKNIVVKLVGHFIVIILCSSVVMELCNDPLDEYALRKLILNVMLSFYLVRGIKYLLDERFSNIGKKAFPVSQEENKKVTRKSKALRWISKLVLNMLMIGFLTKIPPYTPLSMLCFCVLHYHLYDLMGKVVKYIAEKLDQPETEKSKQATQQNKILKSVLEFIAYMLVYLACGYFIHTWHKDWHMLTSLLLLGTAYSYDMIGYLVNEGDPIPSFREDIIHHPLLWVVCAILNIGAGFVFLDSELTRIDKIYTENLILDYVYSLIPHIVLSLWMAIWTSRWVYEGQKREGFVVPSFKTLFLHYFRFMASLSVPLPITMLIFYYAGFSASKLAAWIRNLSPLITSILSYVVIRLYDARKQQKQETKPIPKKDPAHP